MGWLTGDPGSVARAAMTAVLAYTALVALVRISGKRTVAKWNAFDLIVTVALGSALATTILSGDVPLLTGVAVFAVLVALQFVITWTSVRLPFVRGVVKSTPALIVCQGRFLEEQMRTERVTEDEVLAAVRGRGFGDLRTVEAVVLETDGSFSVIGSSERDIGYSTLRNVRGLPE